MTVSGGASFEVQHVNGGAANTGKAWSMGNSVTFSGSGELDNGLTVGVSFELDQGAGAGLASATDSGKPFDSHGLTISSDSLGTITFQGHGGAAAVTAIQDTTGAIWDNSFSATTAPLSASSDNMIAYSNSNLMDGLTVSLSHVPHGTGEYESSMDWALKYTGVEGLTLGFGAGEDNATKGSQADLTVFYGSYAYGPITVAYQQTEYDSENTGTTADQDFVAYSLSYMISDELSVSYHVADLSTPNATGDQDQEVNGVKAAYTMGGMTLSGKMINADNIGFSSAVTADQSMWELAASFAF
jgi:outer membrane protein OmpU